MSKFSQNLKEYRLLLKLTQKDISELLGINLRSYQRYEHGEMEPNIEKLEKLADLFNISLDTLIGRKYPK